MSSVSCEIVNVKARVFCFLDELTASFSCGVKTVSSSRGVGA